MRESLIYPDVQSIDDSMQEVENLKEMVAYQQGSVVSRTLIEKDAGTVTLFAFDAGQGLSEHSAPYDALVNIIDGEASVFIAGERHQVSEGEMLVMPADVPHAVKAEMPFKMMLVMIRQA